MRQLFVYMNDLKAGVLTENTPGKEYTFCYDENYLSTENPSISVTLPKREEPYKNEYLFLSSRTCFKKVLTVGAFAVR